MSARRRTTPSRVSRGLLGAGAISLTAALAVAPGASADPGPAPDPSQASEAPTSTTSADPSPSTTPSAAPSATTSPSPSQTASSTPSEEPTPSASSSPTTQASASAGSSETAAPKLAPDYGSQKYRVGVQVADGSYVPDGTTTVGTTIRVDETGPNVPDGSASFTCTTDQSTVTGNSTASYCLTGSQTRVSPRGVEPGDASIPPEQLYTAQPGSTITLTQLTPAPGLAPDQALAPATIGPCEGDPNSYCPGNGFFSNLITSVTFDDPGLPPVAADDADSTAQHSRVDIDALDNDSDGNGAPLTGFAVATGPGHGSASVRGPVTGPIASAGSISYVPDAGFSGTDTFTYRITTPNGSSTATVRVVVRPAATSSPTPSPSPSPVGPSASASTTPATAAVLTRTAAPTPALPNTGGPSRALLGVGLGLVGAGGALTVVGRRRSRRAASD